MCVHCYAGIELGVGGRGRPAGWEAKQGYEGCVGIPQAEAGGKQTE